MSIDVGNNNHRHTTFKANYAPYGTDFITHKPTGRFCNGKLVIDILTDIMGFHAYPPPYLSPQASGKNLLLGASFASAAAGYDHDAAVHKQAIPLSGQLEYFKEYKSKLNELVGGNKSEYIVKEALYVLSAGTADFLQNYYLSSSLKKAYTPDQYASFLASSFSNFVKELYGLGARRIGVTSLPPLGCLPAAIDLFRSHEKGCVISINKGAQNFNDKINSSAASLRKQFPDLKITVLDIFNPLLEIVQSPSKHGFVEARKGCCGAGSVKTNRYLCKPGREGICSNADEYVFWDTVHLSEATNQLLADAVLFQGLSLV